MFQPSKVSHIRAYPFWRVSLGDRTIYICISRDSI